MNLSLGLGLGSHLNVASGPPPSAPALDLDLSVEPLDSRVTLARSTAGTRFDEAGEIELMAVNAARFDHGPVSLDPLGLLIEEQRTNLNLNSLGPITSYSNKVGVTESGPLIALGGSSIQFTPLGSTAYLYKNFADTAPTASVFSVMIEMDDGSEPVVTGSSLSGDFTLRVNTTGFIPTEVTRVEGNVYRLAVPFTSSTSNGKFGVLKYASQSSKSFKVAGIQIEHGLGASSFIPTAGSQVTRADDVAVMTGTDFSDWYTPAGTIVIEADSPASGTRIVWQADDGTENNRITIWTDGTDAKLTIVDGGVSQAAITLGAITAGTPFRVAVAIDANDIAVSFNGGAVSTDASATIPTVDRCRLGRNTTGDALNGHIRQIDYWDSRKTDVELVDLSS